ncbi:MAG: multiple antibiotic resistance (MarC)-related protein [Myxococcaceae bacterium]|nr:multiple antibiotic resistance (MarC)-related protein [Myxococcaceae bacterium]
MHPAVSFGLTAFTSLFAIVDPFAALPVYLALTAHESHEHRRGTALRASVTALSVLLVFAISGQVLFQFFGISIGAFKIAGGLLLFSVAFDMMNAQVSTTKSTPEENADASSRDDVGLMPVGIPLLSGPGAIASSMVLSARAHTMAEKGALLVAIAAVGLVSWVVLRSATRIARVLGLTGMNIIARVMGLILAAVAAQFIIDGLIAAFPALSRHAA